ncbi:MAG: exodeoxyribonuclease VII small subunit [Clostridia bacterium]|nr:exodeoxyribonuclease VII small subunit [Clostridia bacterium]
MENNELSFEKITGRISEIVVLLDDPKTPLDKSLSLFEEGVTLIKQANAILDEAQKKVKMLTEEEVK